MTHSTANQATLSKLSASQADSTQANSGSCNNDMSETTLKNGMVLVWYFVVLALVLFITSGYFLFQNDYPQAFFSLVGSAVLNIPILTIWHSVYVERMQRKL